MAKDISWLEGKYPLMDSGRLKQGACFDVEEIGEWLQLRPWAPAWSLKVQELRGNIELATGLFCRIMSGSLVIMTDAEAAVYCEKVTLRDGLRKLSRSLRIAQGIDHGALDERDRASHDHRTKMLASVNREARRALRKIRRERALFTAGEAAPDAEDVGE